MKLFKYKSVNGDGLIHVLDMLVNERIYLSTQDKMNDPDEGAFKIIDHFNHSRTDPTFDEKAKSLKVMIDKTKFTSFTLRITDPLLWAHYAGGYSGVAFEYDLPLETNHYEILSINYDGKVKITKDDLENIILSNASLYSFGLLRSKRSEWKYEEEFRLYSKNQDTNYIFNIKPKALIFGLRDQRYYDVLSKICNKCKIPTGILLNKK